MTSISFNLSGKIEKSIIDALLVLKKVADSLGIPFFVIGASARDFVLRYHHGIEPHRKTGDVDLGVEVATWEQFKTLLDSLIATGHFSSTSERQRLRCGTVLLDILPFGDIAGDNKEISWPPEHEMIMSMVGFKEAYEHSITVRVSSDPNLDIRIASLPGLALIKLVSWREKYPVRKRDAEDLAIIMQNYAEAGNLDRLYGEELALLEEEAFDVRLAGTRLLGRDMATISDSKTSMVVKEILEAETEETSQYRLASDIIRETGTSDTRFDEILLQIRKLKQGFTERQS